MSSIATKVDNRLSAQERIPKLRKNTGDDQRRSPHVLSQHSEQNSKQGRYWAIWLRPYKTIHPSL
jgi:hypothetical protein